MLLIKIKRSAHEQDSRHRDWKPIFVTPDLTMYALLSDVNIIAIDASDTSMPMRYRSSKPSVLMLHSAICYSLLRNQQQQKAKPKFRP